MSELGKCPKCGKRAMLYVYGTAEAMLLFSSRSGKEIDHHIHFTDRQQLRGLPVCCWECTSERPDLICREGRIEKREAKNDG